MFKLWRLICKTGTDSTHLQRRSLFVCKHLISITNHIHYYRRREYNTKCFLCRDSQGGCLSGYVRWVCSEVQLFLLAGEWRATECELRLTSIKSGVMTSSKSAFLSMISGHTGWSLECAACTIWRRQSFQRVLHRLHFHQRTVFLWTFLSRALEKVDVNSKIQNKLFILVWGGFCLYWTKVNVLSRIWKHLFSVISDTANTSRRSCVKHPSVFFLFGVFWWLSNHFTTSLQLLLLRHWCSHDAVTDTHITASSGRASSTGNLCFCGDC